jgi:NAD(P)-dependent dehydrogenase (short-subunit alcohol dehydrogenase family)
MTNDVIQGIDLSGKTAIVTGGYAGLGLETTRTLASAGARVVVPARDLDKARHALTGIKQVEIEGMDLIDPESVEAFADRFLASGRSLDILVNSAGIGDRIFLQQAAGLSLAQQCSDAGHFLGITEHDSERTSKMGSQG